MEFMSFSGLSVLVHFILGLEDEYFCHSFASNATETGSELHFSTSKCFFHGRSHLVMWRCFFFVFRLWDFVDDA